MQTPQSVRMSRAVSCRIRLSLQCMHVQLKNLETAQLVARDSTDYLALLSLLKRGVVMLFVALGPQTRRLMSWRR